MPPSKQKRITLSAEHKAALAVGRTQGRAVRKYLEALEQNRPRRGRKRTADSVRKQLTQVETRLDEAEGLERLRLTQHRFDLMAELGREDATEDMASLEKEFIGAAKQYGERKHISYSAWRAVGVPAGVLQKAGISRST
jgi:hypothetical protein